MAALGKTFWEAKEEDVRMSNFSSKINAGFIQTWSALLMLLLLLMLFVMIFLTYAVDYAFHSTVANDILKLSALVYFLQC